MDAILRVITEPSSRMPVDIQPCIRATIKALDPGIAAGIIPVEGSYSCPKGQVKGL